MNPDELHKIALQLNTLTGELLSAVEGRQPLENPIQQFMDEGHAFIVKGCSVAFSEFYSHFKAWLPAHEKDKWDKAAVKKALPFDTFNEGRADQPQLRIDGISFKPPRAPAPAPEPLNPDYDQTAMYWLIYPLKKDGLSYHEIAGHLNALGHRDKDGDSWTAESARLASYD